MALQARSLGRQAFSGRNVSARPVVAARPAAQRVVSCRAMIREWPDPEFTREVLAAFPDQGIASVEEGRALYENGWVYLDVRSEFENQEVGKVKGSVNIPLVNIIRKYDSVKREKVTIKEPNADFIRMVEKKFPDKQRAKLMVACSDGRTYSIDALEALDEAGYVNLAGLKGGYTAWFRVFDNKLNRRRHDGYTENHLAGGGDSCGIHASGAGFERMDKIERWTPPKF